MANGDKPSPGGGNALRPEAEEPPFDRWLRKQLHAMFDEVVNEPLPTELVQLIDQDADRMRREASDTPAGDTPPDKS
jgi:hypothetical protein